MEYLKIVFFIFIYRLIPTSNSQLIYYRDYVRDIAKQFVLKLEDLQITGNGMPMRDFEKSINSTLYGLTAAGDVKFYSGFIVRIDSCSIVETSLNIGPRVTDTLAQVTAQLAFDGVQTAYNIDYSLINYNTTGSFLYWFKRLIYNLEMTKTHETQELNGRIYFLSSENQNDHIAKVYPDNGYTQLVAREIKRSSAFRDQIQASFTDWNDYWQIVFTSVLNEVKFPDICYYC